MFICIVSFSVYVFMDESKVREIVAQNNAELLSQIKDLVSVSVSHLNYFDYFAWELCRERN